MKYLKDAPIVFVHYPIGAGGWFLASLIYFAYDQSESFEFDNKGSGHSNRAIQYINNFYKDFLGSKQGTDILEDNNYENFSSAIESRKARGLESWLKVKNPKSIFDLNKKNFGFVTNIIDTLEQNCRLDCLILFPIINPLNRDIILSESNIGSSKDYFTRLNNVHAIPPTVSETSTAETLLTLEEAKPEIRKLSHKSIIFDNSTELLKLFYTMIKKKTGKSVKKLFPNKINLLSNELHCTTEWVGGKDFFGIESTKKRTVVIEGFVFNNMGLALIINRKDIENQLIPDGFSTKPIDSEYHITLVYPDPKKNKMYGPKYSNHIISNIKKGISGIKILFDEPIVIEGVDKFIFS